MSLTYLFGSFPEIHAPFYCIISCIDKELWLKLRTIRREKKSNLFTKWEYKHTKVLIEQDLGRKNLPSTSFLWLHQKDENLKLEYFILGICYISDNPQ